MTNKSYRPGDRPVDLPVTAAIEHASVPVSATGAAIRTEPWANDAVSPENTTLNLSAYVGVRRPVRRGVQIAVATCPEGWENNRVLRYRVGGRIDSNKPQYLDRRTCAEAKRANNSPRVRGSPELRKRH